MRDMVSQLNSPVAGTGRAPLRWIKLARERLRGWIEARATRAAEAALYQELSRLSNAELERRGIPPGELHRCVSGSSESPTGQR